MKYPSCLYAIFFVNRAMHRPCSLPPDLCELSGRTFGPILRNKLTPLFVEGLLKLMRKSVLRNKGQVKLSKLVDEKTKDAESLIKASFSFLYPDEPGPGRDFANELGRDFAKTLLLEVACAGRAEIADLQLRPLKKQCMKRLGENVEKIVTDLIIGDKKSEQKALVKLPIFLQEALSKVLTQGLHAVIEDVL